jgi:hypothetical protein
MGLLGDDFESQHLETNEIETPAVCMSTRSCDYVFCVVFVLSALWFSLHLCDVLCLVGDTVSNQQVIYTYIYIHI